MIANSDFGGVTFNVEEDKINALSNAIEAYNKVLTGADTETDPQDAIDRLTTAYVDQSGVLNNLLDNLDNVTEAQKEYVKEQLTAQGITNADEVVESRLTKEYKLHAEALTNLSKKVAEYRNDLDQIIETGEDANDTAIEMVDSVRELLTVYSDEGEELYVPEIDSQFVIDNLKDIINATEGDIDAMNRLMVKIAEVNAKNILVEAGIDDATATAQASNIMNMVAAADSMNIEVGASIEDSAFLAELANMMNTSQSAADAIAAAFESMGYTVQWNDKKTTATIPEVTNTQGAGATNIQAMRTSMLNLNVPELKITRNKTYTGAKTTYGGASTPSSSGLGGGSGDSGSGSESEETFDWISVAIDRLENNLDKLSETVDSTYENWESRNKAIAASIDETNKEIELQKQGAERYLAEANSVDLSEEYKKKVREGKIDIETIKNDDELVSNIQTYQSLWEKYQDAMDKSKTLTQTIQGYYEQLFDNVATQYEQLLDNISAKTEIIDERISRMEEHGYFVDEQYYKEQQKLEQDNNKKLTEERDALIKKLEEAVKKGTIKKGSESWQEMYKKIQSINKQLEESKTKMVELNNAILELQWSKFDWIEERLKDINEEATFLQNILSNKNLFKNDVSIVGESKQYSSGEFSNAGMATAALTMARYDEDIAAARRYQTEIEKINAKLAKDPNNTKLIEQKEEYIQAQRESIEAAEQEKQAIKSLVQEAIEKNVEALNKLIEKFKESLQSSRDLYSYQKNINDQVKSISSLEKQLAAYQNDDSEGSRKKKLELQQQLDEARTGLQETQWDKYISETSEMLSDMSEDYENFLNSKLDDIKSVIQGVTDEINANKKAVSDGLKEISNEYGIATQNFEDFRKNTYSKSNKGIVSAFNNGWSNVKAAILEVNRTLVSKLKNVTNTNNNANGSTTKNEEGQTETKTDSKTKKNTKVTTESASQNLNVNKDGTLSLTNTKNNSDDKSGDNTKNNDKNNDAEKKTPKNGWLNSIYYENGKKSTRYVRGRWMTNATGSWYRYYDKNTKKYLDYYNKTVFIDGFKYYINDKGYVDPSKTKAVKGWEHLTKKKQQTGRDARASYAKGTRYVPSDQEAWTQENEKGELIYRTTDGAILTPLNKGDMVFTHEQTEMLYDISKNGLPYLMGSENINRYICNNSNKTNNLTINIDQVIANDPLEFAERLRNTIVNDKQTDYLIKQITVGEMMGENSLGKNKYK